MKKVGFIGWRGMVGTVLMNRMKEENDFNQFHTTFLSTSKIGEKAPIINYKQQNILIENSWNIDLLNTFDIIITCQGSTYTNIIYPKLKKINWKGYWIDSSSSLRMDTNSIIVLDPINQLTIQNGINNNIKTFIGGNCTVSLMLMALGGLFSENLIEKISISTYQAASGYGANAIHELLIQMGQTYKTVEEFLINNEKNILNIENTITQFIKTNNLPKKCFKIPLIGNVIPWIGENKLNNNGQTQEEWKGHLETNKILNTKVIIPIDSICVRVGTLRCHSQTLFLKLKKDISIPEIETLLKSHNQWTKVIPNDMKKTLNTLTPISVSGTLTIPIGRLRKMNAGKKYLSAFTVGDQLLWGAAEPLRRILKQLTK